MSTNGHILVCDVGPRDGLQNEPGVVPVADKVAFVEGIVAAGVREVEVGSFVRPDRVPQMAETAAVFAGLTRRAGVTCSALVPNLHGLEAALAAGVDKIAVLSAASETFCRQNLGVSIDESVSRLVPVVDRARAAGLPVRGYVSCVVKCPYEGPIAPVVVADVAGRLLDAGVTDLDLGETLGVATPDDVARVYDALSPRLPPAQTTLHLHDTHGGALACVGRALDLGVRRFDASCGGLGGCPFAPGAAGNVATHAVVSFLHARGWTTGINPAKLPAPPTPTPPPHPTPPHPHE